MAEHTEAEAIALAAAHDRSTNPNPQPAGYRARRVVAGWRLMRVSDSNLIGGTDLVVLDSGGVYEIPIGLSDEGIARLDRP